MNRSLTFVPHPFISLKHYSMIVYYKGKNFETFFSILGVRHMLLRLWALHSSDRHIGKWMQSFVEGVISGI